MECLIALMMLAHGGGPKLRQAPLPPQAPGGVVDDRPHPRLPAGARKFGSTSSPRWTQFVFTMGGRGMIGRTLVADPKWTTPGGLLGVRGWRAERFKLVPGKVAYRVGSVLVRNRFGVMQQEERLERSYPDGSRFDEVLINDKTGRVFEHRVRRKEGGAWKSFTAHDDPSEYPAGYTGLTMSCASCHSKEPAGDVAEYSKGLVPGGDTVISDPIDFSMVDALPGVRFYDGPPGSPVALGGTIPAGTGYLPMIPMMAATPHPVASGMMVPAGSRMHQPSPAMMPASRMMSAPSAPVMRPGILFPGVRRSGAG